MRKPGPAAGSTVTGDGAARGGSSSWPRMVLYTAPVVVIALYGALWIALHAGGGRGSTHTFFQSLALAEAVLALLLRRRKPVGAFAGVLVAYALFSLDPLLLPAVLFGLLTVAAERDRRGSGGHRRLARYRPARGQLRRAQPAPAGRGRGRGRRRDVPAGPAESAGRQSR